MEERANNEEVATEEPDKPETDATTSVTPKVGDELEGENKAHAKSLSSPSKDPREEFEEDAIETPDKPAEEREDDVPKTFEISCTTRKKFI